MNNRERMLLIFVGAAAGLLVVKVVVGKYFGVLDGYDQQIKQLEKDYKKAKSEKTLAGAAQMQW